MEKALEIEQRLPYHTTKADTHLNMCAVLSGLDKHDLALSHAQSAIILCKTKLRSNCIVQTDILKAFLPKRDKIVESEE